MSRPPVISKCLRGVRVEEELPGSFLINLLCSVSGKPIEPGSCPA